jgi:hypothetical protein
MHTARRRRRRRHDENVSHLDVAAPPASVRCAPACTTAAQLVGLHGHLDAAHATL